MNLLVNVLPFILIITSIYFFPYDPMLGIRGQKELEKRMIERIRR